MKKGQLTKRRITNALLDLLKEKSIDKITVNELVEYAGIGRSTFYRYYHDVFEVYEDTLDDFLDRVTSFMEKFIFSHTSTVKLMESITDRWEIKNESTFYREDIKAIRHIFENKSKIGNNFLKKFYSGFAVIFSNYLVNKGFDKEKADFCGSFISKTVIISYCHDFKNDIPFSPQMGEAAYKIIDNIEGGNNG